MPTKLITPKDKGKTQYIHRSAGIVGIVESKIKYSTSYINFQIQRQNIEILCLKHMLVEHLRRCMH